MKSVSISHVIAFHKFQLEVFYKLFSFNRLPVAVSVMIPRLLLWAILAFGLIGCKLPEAIGYSLFEEPIVLEDQNVVIRTFDLPKTRSVRAITLSLGHLPASTKNTGQFNINGNSLLEFKLDILMESGTNDSVSRFDIPRDWLALKANTIRFEHLNGNGVTIANVLLEYR